MNFIRSTLFLLALFSVNLLAQDTKDPQTTRVFRTLGLGVNISNIYYRNNKKDVPISVIEDARSEFFPLPSSPVLEFYRLEKSQDGSDLRIPVAKASVPASGAILLFVFIPGSSSEFIVGILDDSLESFPAGSYRFLNRTDQQLQAIIKDQSAAIPSGGLGLIEPKGNGTTAYIQLFMPVRSGPRIFYSNNWAYYKNQRTLVVIVPPLPPSKSPLVRRLPEPISALQAPTLAPADKLPLTQ